MALNEHKFIILGGLAALAVIVLLVKKNGGIVAVAADAGKAAGEAVVAAAGGAVAGVSEAIGDAIGIPRTEMTECEKAIAEGRTWDASFACPAGTFLSSINPFK